MDYYVFQKNTCFFREKISEEAIVFLKFFNSPIILKPYFFIYG